MLDEGKLIIMLWYLSSCLFASTLPCEATEMFASSRSCKCEQKVVPQDSSFSLWAGRHPLVGDRHHNILKKAQKFDMEVQKPHKE